MVRLARLPERRIIAGFYGKIDFYMYKNTAVARRWPRWKPREPWPTERANQTDFAYINQVARNLPVFVINQYKRMVVGTNFSWKDLLVRSYMKGLDY